MVVHSSTLQIESKAVPGVAFVIRKMTAARREALDERMAEALEEARPLREQMQPLVKEYHAAVETAKTTGAEFTFPEERLKEMVELGHKINRIDATRLTPMRVAYGLVRIIGLSYQDDEETAALAPTLALLRDRGPDVLYFEIARAVRRELGLEPDEVENLESPSTSAAAVDGGAKSGSADAAGRLVTITGAGVPSTTVLENVNATVTAGAQSTTAA